MLAVVSVTTAAAGRWRLAGAATAALFVLAGCTGGGSIRSSEAPSAPAGPTRSTLPPVVLHADLTERPAPWRLVASIPYGTRPGELGRVPEGGHTPVQYLPMSFTVAADRSIWILDWVKKRLAHFTSGGRFIGAVHGLFADRFHPHGVDVMMAGGEPVVLEARPSTRALRIAVAAAGGGFTRRWVRFSGDGVRGGTLYPNGTAPGVSVDGRPYGRAGGISYSPRGFGRIDVRSGALSMLPGVPLGDGSYLAPHDLGEPSFSVEFIGGRQRTSLPVRIRVTAGRRTVGGIVAEYVQTSLVHGAVFWVQAEPSRAVDVRRYGSGRWLLAVFDDGSPLLWERLPDPVTDDEILTRHLASGPGDSIYLMQATKDGISISRREGA